MHRYHTLTKVHSDTQWKRCSGPRLPEVHFFSIWRRFNYPRESAVSTSGHEWGFKNLISLGFCAIRRFLMPAAREPLAQRSARQWTAVLLIADGMGNGKEITEALFTGFICRVHGGLCCFVFRHLFSLKDSMEKLYLKKRVSNVELQVFVCLFCFTRYRMPILRCTTQSMFQINLTFHSKT